MLRKTTGGWFRNQRRTLLVGSAIVGSALVLFHDVLLLGRSFHGRDVTPFFYPMKHFLAETVRSGGIPLWNPWVASGEPFFASLQPGVFYPPSVLLYLLPFPFAFDLLTVLHFPLAGIGFFLLLRRWHHGVAGAIVGSVAFMLGGYLVSLGNFLNNLQTVAWLPWLFLLWDRYLENGAGKDLIGFALLAALAFLGGEPQMLALGLAVLCLHGLLRVEERDLPGARQLLGLGMAGVLAMGVAAFQLLPFLEYMGESVRTMGLTIDYSARTSLEPTALWHLLIPPVLGVGPFGFTTQHLFSAEVPWLLSVYPGAVVLLLSALGLSLPKSHRWLIFWSVCGVLGVLLAMGSHSALYTVLHDLFPPIRPLRYPEKFYFLTALALPVLAARGTDVCLRAPTDGRRRIVPVLAGFLTLYLVLAGLVWFVPDLFVRLCGNESLVRACGDPGGSRILYTRALIWPAVAVVGIALLLLLSRRGAIRPSLLAGTVVVFCAVDLLLPHRAVNPSVEAELHGRTPWAVQEIHAREANPEWYRFRATPISRVGDLFRVRGAWELSNLYLMHEAAGANRGQVYGLLHQDAVQGIELRSVAETVQAGVAADGVRALNLLRATGVRYNTDVTSFTGALPGVDAVATHPELPLTLYRIPDPLPRAYLASRFRVEENRRRALWTAMDPDFELGAEVVLDREPSTRPAADAGGEILEAEFGREVVRVRVRADGPIVLALTDRAHPGWEARVGGARADLYTANGYFRAVVVPEGMHDVVFRYRPRSTRIGGGISIIALLGLTVFGLGRRRNAA